MQGFVEGILWEIRDDAVLSCDDTDEASLSVRKTMVELCMKYVSLPAGLICEK